MLGYILESVTLADLQGLVDDKVSEGKTIEYKREFYRLESTNKDDKTAQHEEMLKDISSFANTLGGDLIIGMDEAKGVATDVCGFAVPNPDALKLRITQLVQKWLEPRIAFSIHSVPHSTDRFVFIIRVRRSMLAPHRVVYQNNPAGQFWARTSSGAHQMDTSELRQAFAFSETLFERIKTFRDERIKAIAAGQTPVPLANNSHFICHLIPLDSFASHIAFSAESLNSMIAHLPLLGFTGGRSSRFNLDGLVTFDRLGDQASSGYVQLYRNGTIEVLADGVTYHYPADTLHQSPFLKTTYVADLISAFPHYLRCLSNLGITPPVWCFLTITGVAGARITPNDASRMTHRIDRSTLFLPEIEIIDLNVTSCAGLLRPLVDMLWNAAGYVKCPNYSQEGEYLVSR